MKVRYEDENWETLLGLRESLFLTYQENNPNAIVKLTKEHSLTKYVKISEIQLYSNWRNGEKKRNNFN